MQISQYSNFQTISRCNTYISQTRQSNLSSSWDLTPLRQLHVRDGNWQYELFIYALIIQSTNKHPPKASQPTTLRAVELVRQALRRQHPLVAAELAKKLDLEDLNRRLTQAKAPRAHEKGYQSPPIRVQAPATLPNPMPKLGQGNNSLAQLHEANKRPQPMLPPTKKVSPPPPELAWASDVSRLTPKQRLNLAVTSRVLQRQVPITFTARVRKGSQAAVPLDDADQAEGWSNEDESDDNDHHCNCACSEYWADENLYMGHAGPMKECHSYCN